MEKHYKISLLAALLLFFAVMGCESEPEPPEEAVPMQSGPKPEAAPPVTETAPVTNGKIEDAAQRREFDDQVEARVAQLGQQIANLKERIDALSVEQRSEAEQTLRSLEAQQEVVEARVNELKSVSNEGWQDLKQNTEQALEELEQASNALQASLQRQI